MTVMSKITRRTRNWATQLDRSHLWRILLRRMRVMVIFKIMLRGGRREGARRISGTGCCR